MQKALRPRADIQTAVLKSYTADIAKWRYETVTTVLSALDEVSEISQHELKPEWFQNVKDRVKLAQVFDACADTELWKFIKYANKEVFKKIERSRRWGMICTCEDVKFHAHSCHSVGHHIRINCLIFVFYKWCF